MAQPDLQSFTRRALALALRASAGTPVVPTPALNGVWLLDGSSGTEVDVIERALDRPHYGNQPFAVGNKRAYVEGDFELYPPATPGELTGSDADCGVFLLPAGMTVVKDAVAKTTRYNPVSSGIAVSDAYWWHAGTLKHVAAARHNITQVGITIGDRFKGRVRIEGGYENVAEDALPNNFNRPDVTPTVARSSNTETRITLLPGGTPLVAWGKSLVLEFGSTMAKKEYTSHEEFGISARAPTAALRIARTAKADFDPWAVRDAGTLLTASLRLTEADGRYSEIGVRGQIESITEADIDGDYGWDISLRAIPSETGGDEFYFEFGGVP